MSDQQRRPGPYPPEVRERAVRMVFEHQDEYPSQWKAIESISAKLSINHATLRQWVRRAEIDSIAFRCDGYSPWCSNTIRTARSRTSGGYGGRPTLFDSDICSSSQGDEQSPIPGRFSSKRAGRHVTRGWRGMPEAPRSTPPP